MSYNGDWVKQEQIEVKYYYIYLAENAEVTGNINFKHISGHAVASVCLLHRTNTIRCFARGISVCSAKDQFHRRLGRAKALGRAVQAMKRRESIGVIPQVLRRFEKFHSLAEFMYEYVADLTPFEKDLYNDKY
jgi:hypothetical protein